MNIINWDNVFQKSDKFKNQQPFKFGYIKNIFNNSFYENLYNDYPKLDDFTDGSDMSKNQLVMQWGKVRYQKLEPVMLGQDTRFSEEWNQLKLYAESEEFIKKLVEVTGVEVTGLRHFCFMYAKKDCFQSPHIHNVSDKTLIVFLYFSKNWEEGDPGGTFLSDGLDESKILFEPYDLDNTALFVLDGPEAAHGMRKIIKDVERRAIQLTYEPFSTTNGWYGELNKDVFEPIEL